eukprot:NODE_50_length_31184_cov_0.705099.p8 type:complete len:389 gc:universal NODE_50_length_31184_cov_0.705099:25145-26311(+)
MGKHYKKCENQFAEGNIESHFISQKVFYFNLACEKLLKKFLVRDPTKRGTLDIFVDDPWINEGFDNSPIVTDTSSSIIEDEVLIKLIEQKFSIPTEQIRKSIREEVYDDISSLYYMMYHEKHKTDSIEQASKVLEGNATNVVRDPPPVPPQVSANANKMDKISEDEQANHHTAEESKTPNAGDSTSMGRRRRFTVAGEQDVQKIAAEENDDEALKKLEELRKAVGNEEQDGQNEDPVQRRARTSSNNGFSGMFRKSMVEQGSTNTSQATTAANQSRRDSNASQTTSSTVGDDKPRSLRFTFNSNNTSSKPPEDIVQQIIAACQKLGYSFKLTGRYVLEITPMAGLKLEVEVCRLPLLKNLYGLKFRRSTGSGNEYKEASEKILGLLVL